jgi:hypothetical protein
MNNYISYAFIIYFILIVFMVIVVGILKSQESSLDDRKRIDPISIFPLPMIAPVKPTKLLCFAGGGMSAVTSYAGVIGGVIGRINRDRGDNKPTRLNNYLNQYDIMSGVSGGSWFMSLVTYSNFFYNLIDREADGENMFHEEIECISTTPLNLSSEKCTGSGISNCQYNDESKCCCDLGFKNNKDGVTCDVCSQQKTTTFVDYIRQTVYYGLIIADRNNEELSENEELWKILKSVLPSITTVVLDFVKSNTTYDEFLLYWLFRGLGDVDRDVVISNNPNGLTNSVVFCANVLKSSHVSGKYGEEKMVKYHINSSDPEWCIGDDTIEQCGLDAVPLTMGYNFGENKQAGPIYEGSHNLNINYMINDKPESTISLPLTDNLKKINITNESVVSLCTASGGAVALVSSPEYIESAINKLPKAYSNSISYSEGAYCYWNYTDSICGVSAYLSSKYDKLSTVFKTNPDKSGFTCIERENGKCSNITDQEYSNTWDQGNKLIRDEIPVRLYDSGYTDNTSVVASLIKFQKSGKTGKCKIISMGRHDAGIEKLFGADWRCRSLVSNENEVDYIYDTPSRSSKIFPTRSCWANKTMLYQSPPHTESCGDKGCVGINIDVWDNLTTLKNTHHGIEPGTKCIMFFVNVKVSSFPFPILDGWSTAADDQYSNMVIKQSKILHDLISEIPTDIFNLVFMD